MKYQVFIALFAFLFCLINAEEAKPTEDRSKRGLLAAAPLGYASPYAYPYSAYSYPYAVAPAAYSAYSAPLAAAYSAPVAAPLVAAPYAKSVVAPAYTSYAYYG